jgi:hypothetical protein
MVPDSVGTHRALLGRCQRTHSVAATRAPKFLQGTAARPGDDRLTNVIFGLELERHGFTSLFVVQAIS